ncbi:MAG: nucleotidyl transferase AbiEii/AbiGii toxin family protein [Desulfobacteraceae bacterium]|nr:nucleotidyl transferase AbiEii/AbiGii toxin family protein [Desulfobacteraceae bacterium]MBC2751948.1 nucleotidyl transferase AbiEii/AbiGii toxin family protein [Desulfobacteraceae bacterium]
MSSNDITQWVEAESDPRTRPFREAVHIVLIAISRLGNFKNKMVMKGGILLAIRYGSTRYTRDIDFSTEQKASDFTTEQFIKDFNDKLALVAETLDYGLSCIVQSHRMKPPSEEASFPTLKLKIGYAYKHNTREHKRLMNKNSSQVVAVDYSFNEFTQDVDMLKIAHDSEIPVYSFTDLIAEKYRAIIQQEIRNRYRRQDVYDLNFLLTRFPTITDTEKTKILKSLTSKANSRSISVDKNMLSREETKMRSKRDYENLVPEIDEDLPPFENAYLLVKNFYESLPW